MTLNRCTKGIDSKKKPKKKLWLIYSQNCKFIINNKMHVK